MSTTPISTNSSGDAISGTSGSSIDNSSADAISSNEFLELMIDTMQDQDPLDPDSSDPTQYLSELAQITSTEEETDTASNTSTSSTEQAVSSAIGLIGDTVSYTSQTSGETVTGTVNSVQITSSGATLTVDGVAGIDPSTITNVAPSSSTDNGSGTASDAS